VWHATESGRFRSAVGSANRHPVRPDRGMNWGSRPGIARGGRSQGSESRRSRGPRSMPAGRWLPAHVRRMASDCVGRLGIIPSRETGIGPSWSAGAGERCRRRPRIASQVHHGSR
jgi:hypothetical protein